MTRSYLRKFSLHKSLSARASMKRALRQVFNVHTPRGEGWLTNPKRALYNRVYDRTSVNWVKLLLQMLKKL